MTTEELIKKLNENERVVVHVDAFAGMPTMVNIYSDSDEPLLGINSTATNWLECEFYRPQFITDSLGGATREYISSLISQYLNTPVSERESDKYYRLRWLGQDTYLCLHDPDFGDRYWKICNKEHATMFNEDCLESLKHNNPLLAPAIDAMKEEIKDDED